MSHDADPVDLLHRILEIIAFKKETNEVTLFSVYPLIDTPSIQPIPHIYKNHLMGLFLELNLVYTHVGKLQSRGIDKWNSLVFNKGFSFNQTRIKGKKIIELSVMPVHTKEVHQQEGKNKLSDADKSYLSRLRLKYIEHCNMHHDDSNSDSDPDANDANGNEDDAADDDDIPNKRGPPVTTERNPSLTPKHKRMRTFRIGTSKFPVVVPRQVHVESAYSHTQLILKLTTLEAENKTMRERINELECAHEKDTSEVDKLTLNLGNAQITNESLEFKIHELSSLHDSEIRIITVKLTKLEELVLQLKLKINEDRHKVNIGSIMLNLPESGKKWKGTCNSKRYYSLAYTTMFRKILTNGNTNDNCCILP